MHKMACVERGSCSPRWLFAALAVVTATSLAESTELCGRTQYEPSKSVCCGGRLRDRLPASVATACCGNVAYDPTVEMCCNRHLIARAPYGSEAAACCGIYAYDTRTTFCCGGVKYSRGRSPQRLACCGTAAYDAAAGLCCGGAVVTGVSDYRDAAACCGPRAYDSSKYMCCGGTVTSKVGYERPACCGTSVHENGTASCCDGVSVRLPAGWHCCADIPRGAKDYCCFSGFDGSALCPSAQGRARW